MDSRIHGYMPSGRPIIGNDDGSFSTERTVTRQLDDGYWYNIPTLYSGQEVSEAEAARRVTENGFIDPDTRLPLMGFNSPEEAGTAAQARSDFLGRAVQRALNDPVSRYGTHHQLSVPASLANIPAEIGFGEGLLRAVDLDWSLLAVSRMMQDASTPFDPNFVLTEEMLGKLGKDLPTAYLERFTQARSLQHAEQIRARILLEMDHVEKLQSMGTPAAVTARIVAGLTDPGALVLGLATPVAPLINRGTWLWKTLKAGAYGAGTNAALEYAIMEGSQTRGPEDVLHAAIFGALVSSAITGAIVRSDPAVPAPALGDRVRQVGDNVMHEELRARSASPEVPVVSPTNNLEAPSFPEQLSLDFPYVPPEQLGLDLQGGAMNRTTVDLGLTPREVPREPEQLGLDLAQEPRQLPLGGETSQLDLFPDLREPTVVRGYETAIPEPDTREFSGLLDLDSGQFAMDFGTTPRQGGLDLVGGEMNPPRVVAVSPTEQLDLGLTQRSPEGQLGLDLQGGGMTSATRDLGLPTGRTRAAPEGAPALPSSAFQPPPGSAGAAGVHSTDTTPLVEADDIIEELMPNGAENVPVAALAGASRAADGTQRGLLHRLTHLRMSPVARLGSSPIALVRAGIQRMANDWVGYTDPNIAVPESAVEISDRVYMSIGAPMRRVVEDAYGEWARQTGRSTMGRLFSARTRAEYNAEVSDVIRGVQPGTAGTQRAAEGVREFFSKFLERGKNAGVNGLEDVEADPGYLPRIANQAAIREAINRYGQAEVTRAVYESMVRARQRAYPGMPITDELTEVLQVSASGYLRTMAELSVGVRPEFMHGLSLQDVYGLRKLLRLGIDSDPKFRGLDEAARGQRTDEMIAILRRYAEPHQAGPDPSRMPRAKRRVDLDESSSSQLMVRNGPGAGTAETFEVTRLFERDIDRLMTMYARTMGGWIGLAEKGFKSPRHVELWIRASKEQAAETGASTRDLHEMEKDMRFVYDFIRGKPLDNDPMSFGNQTLRAFRDWNFMRLMGQSGFAQLPEIGLMLGTAGIKNVLTHVPAFRDMVRAARNGTLTNDLARAIEEMSGAGVDRLVHQPQTHWDDAGYGIGDIRGSRGSRIAAQANYTLQQGTRLVADISGMHPITIGIQKLSSFGILQKLVNWALRNGDLSAGNIKQLRSMGLSDEAWRGVQQGLRTYGTFVDSLWSPNRKIARLDTERWARENPESFADISAAVHRLGRRIVQTNDPAAMARWMSHPLARALLQFRTYTLNAWEKQTLHSIHQRTFAAWSSFMMSMFLGGLAYVGRSYVNYGHDEKKMEQLLEPTALARAAFERSGQSSLIPMLVDTGGKWLLDETFFGQSRTTGQPSELITGSPLFDLTGKVFNTTSSLAHSVTKDEELLTQKNVRDFIGLLPYFGNMPGMQRLMALETITNLPKK